VAPFVLKNLMPNGLNSHRRRLSLLRVARTIADLAGDEVVESRHLRQAEHLTHRPFLDFRQAYN
jgi:predicted ATPase with chaperone activity